MRKIRLSLKERSYDILIGRGLIRKCAHMIKRLGIGRDAVIITNKRLQGLYGKTIASFLTKTGISVRFELAPDSEAAKSSDVAIRILNRLGKYDRMKEIFIIALGGGVIGDLSGFVASVYKRGIPYIQIPTTLLAQVDSAIGGKAAIDLDIAKNLVGSFYQPWLVLSDTDTLKTLSPRQVRNGLAEIIKYGVINDAPLFEFLEKNHRKVLRLDPRALEFVIWRSCLAKARIVEKDERDTKGLRAILNLGHTIGHAIEAAAGYSAGYNHGEAVGVGMIAASEISSVLGLATKDTLGRIRSLISAAGLPARVRGLKFQKIYESHLRDKKFLRGKNRFVLPISIGKTRIVQGVPDIVVRNAIRKVQGRG